MKYNGLELEDFSEEVCRQFERDIEYPSEQPTMRMMSSLSRINQLTAVS